MRGPFGRSRNGVDPFWTRCETLYSNFWASFAVCGVGRHIAKRCDFRRFQHEMVPENGRILGIDVNLHFTFLLLLGFVGLASWQRTHDWEAALIGVGFMVALFGCVLLHEFGHALMARKYGIRTQDITLLPIGGVAQLERMPQNPIQEFWVALAGPAVNVAIPAVLWIWLAATRGFSSTAEFAMASGESSNG